MGLIHAVRQRLDARAAQAREALRRSMPKTPLGARHVEGARLLPNRLALLDAMPKGMTMAEVGVADGDFSVEILSRCAPKRLHLVDAWHTGRYVDGENSIRSRFATEIAEGKVVIHKGLSTEVLKDFPESSLDFVYIDTDHSYRLTAAELALCNRLVGPGGRIAGHDFCTGNVARPVVYGVVQAVNEFCVEAGWRYEYVTLDSDGHFSFCLLRLDEPA